jgi:hypothetical protein
LAAGLLRAFGAHPTCLPRGSRLAAVRHLAVDGVVAELARDAEAVARDEDAVVDHGSGVGSHRDAVGAEGGDAGPAAELAGGAAIERHRGDRLAGARDLDAQLEGQHLTERRHRQVGLGYFLAERSGQVRSLEADRLAVHEPEALEHEHARPLTEPQRRGHAAVGGGRVAAHEACRHVLAERGEVAGQRSQVEDVVVDGRAGDEGAEAVPAGDQAVALEQVERLAERHEGDPELAREAPLIVQALARPLAARDDPLAEGLRDLVIPWHATGQVNPSPRVF